jgi:hypothetical protein
MTVIRLLNIPKLLLFTILDYRTADGPDPGPIGYGLPFRFYPKVLAYLSCKIVVDFIVPWHDDLCSEWD